CSLGFGYRLGEGFLHLVGIRHYARRSQFIRECTLAQRPAPVNARLCSALESGLEVAYRVSSVVLTAEDIQLSFRNNGLYSRKETKQQSQPIPGVASVDQAVAVTGGCWSPIVLK